MPVLQVVSPIVGRDGVGRKEEMNAKEKAKYIVSDESIEEECAWCGVDVGWKFIEYAHDVAEAYLAALARVDEMRAALESVSNRRA